MSSSESADFTDILSATTHDGLGNTVINRNGSLLTLTGVLKAQLNAVTSPSTARRR